MVYKVCYPYENRYFSSNRYFCNTYIEYFLNKKTSKVPGTGGLYCFKDLDCAKKFAENEYSLLVIFECDSGVITPAKFITFGCLDQPNSWDSLVYCWTSGEDNCPLSIPKGSYNTDFVIPRRIVE